MAAYVWTAAVAGNWSVGSNWSVGGVAQSVPPTAADDVALGTGTGATQSNCTLDTTSVCRSLNTTGYTGTFTHNAFTLSIGDGTAGTGSVALTLVAGMIYTLANAKTSAISFVSTSVTQQTITTGGQTLGTIVVNGAGNSYKLLDAFTSSGNFTYTAGTTFDTTTNSIIITLNGAGITFAGNGKTYFELDSTGSGAVSVTGANTFTNFKRVGTAVKTDSININGNQTVTGTLTLSGNTTQGANRLFVSSNTVGTQRTFSCTGAAVVISGDVDFQDITITGSPSWTNSGSAYIGVCGGNGGLASSNATVAAAQTRSGAGGNWSTAGNWTSRAPLPQDNVTVNGSASGTITQDMPRMGLSIDFTGFAGTCALNNVAFSWFGSLTFSTGMTLTPSSGIQATFSGRSAFSLTSNTKASSPLTINAPGGTLTLQDDYTNNASSSTALVLTLGTLTAVGNVTLGGTGNGTRFSMTGGTLNMGNLIWNIVATGGGTNWNVTGGTLNANSSTINLSGASATGRAFGGGGKTYNNLSITGGAGSLTITGANTFAALPQVTGGTLSIVWPGSTTTTFTTGGNFGNGTNVITMTASAGSTTLSFGSQVNADFLNLTNIIAAGTTPAYAGANSTDGGGNTNWTFTAAPSTATGTYRTLTGVGI